MNLLEEAMDLMVLRHQTQVRGSLSLRRSGSKCVKTWRKLKENERSNFKIGRTN